MAEATATEKSGKLVIQNIGLLLSGDIALALVVCRLAFDVPVRGSLVLLVFAGMMCVFAGVGIGIFIATFTRSQQQAQLMSFFVNPPIAMLSGVTTPLESIPHALQPITWINPVRHFAMISRGILLKGVGFQELWVNFVVLGLIAVTLVGVSVWQFRKQLS